MGFDVTFYKFNKEGNSTKRPSSGGTTYSCKILRGSSVIAPTIELNLGLTTAPDFNYCYIQNFNRYYYVGEWTFNEALLVAQLEVDALATYRTEIGSENLYALRTSNSSLYDGRIPDTLYPTKAECSFDTETINPIWLLPDPQTLNGVFILGCTSEGGLFDFGSIRYYGLTPAAMYNVSRYLLSDDLLSLNQITATDASEELLKSLIDPLQFIKSCVFIPLPYPYIADVLSDTAQTVKVFSWEILDLNNNPISAKRVYNFRPIYSTTKQIPIPKHPQTATRGSYVNQSPYTTLTLCVPPFGVIELDTTITCDADYVDIEVHLDLPTGLGVMDVKCNGILVNSLTSQIGVNVQLSQVTRDYVGGVTSIVSGLSSGIGSIATGSIGSGISSIASGIGNAINSLCPRSQSIGTGGSYGQLFSESPRIDAQFFEIVDDDIAKNGRPCCKIVNCSSGGYFLIQDGDVPISGTKAEWQMIKDALEGGFYWE